MQEKDSLPRPLLENSRSGQNSTCQGGTVPGHGATLLLGRESSSPTQSPPPWGITATQNTPLHNVNLPREEFSPYWELERDFCAGSEIGARTQFRGNGEHWVRVG